MSSIARWCHARRLAVVLLWLGLIVGLGAGAMSAGAAYTNSTNMPNTESSTALNLMSMGSSGASGDSGTIVWQTVDDAASVTASSVEQSMDKVLAEIAEAPGVASVTSPYIQQGAAQISEDGHTAYATVVFDKSGADLPKDQVEHVEELASEARTSSLDVEFGGTAFGTGVSVSELSEIIGIGAALVVLLLMFRSVWAAALPILTGVAGVGTALFATILFSHVVTLPDTTPTMGALIGLGVGIDYALFIVHRHRRGLMAGMSVAEASAKALNTSGRAVVFAGLTVVVALLGMLTLGVGILSGMALGAAMTVVLTVLAAVTLLPAILGLLGHRVLGRRQRREVAVGRFTVPGEPTGRWARWSSLVQRRPKVMVAVSIMVMAAMALPALSIRLGSADAGNNPTSSSSRQAYDMLADGFGPGFNGPLVLAAEAPDAQAQAHLTDLADDLKTVDGVASVTAVPMQQGQDVGVVTVLPDSSPQSEQTTDLIDHLRDDVIPAAEQGSDLQVYVGGVTASNADFASTLTSKIPLFLGLIVILGFVLLTLAFRSLLIPAIGAVMNLLTMGAAFGAIVLVFQHGFGSSLLGAGSAGPIEAVVPVLIVGVMFGLSMDYQVFLVSRMHEEFSHTKDNRRSVRVGQADTALVIAVAATIMFCVFAAFAGGGMRLIAEFGVGLAVAVLLDAFVVRMMLVPALMHLSGKATWWLPRWLDRCMPHFSVEGDSSSDHADPPAAQAMLEKEDAGVTR
ncbi:RND superfamily putative drug exporter [Streptomyces sp. LBL]|uniref:MMPL family transporter n=1 Tax=Streptomyces sp. LBL TaxID=2940562 RepID=UPI00247438FF|nr:MMPL family transporter [Streptomyces sp. LBL]MDH6622334.1 RND superfamily putative drug exporter [Streptomyces sp. LBL]